MEEVFFVAITAIHHGEEVLDEETGQMVNKVIDIPVGTRLSASEIGSDELVATFIELGSIAEYKDVIVVEDTAKIETLETEKAEILADSVAKDEEIAKLKAALDAASKKSN